MKKSVIILFLLSVCIARAQTVSNYIITNSGGAITIAPSSLSTLIYIHSDGSARTLSNDWSIATTSTPKLGVRWTAVFDVSSINFNGHTISIFGQSISSTQAISKGYFDFYVVGGGITAKYSYAPFDLSAANAISGAIIQSGTIPKSALDTTGRARVLVGSSTNITTSIYSGGSGKILIGDGADLQSLAVTGDVLLNSAGVTRIDSVIVDADIKTGAAIKRQKIAAGSASAVIVNNSSGYLTEESTLNPLRGGLGADVSASTGFVTFSSGSSVVGSITDMRDLHVSFATTGLGTYYITFPINVTVTDIEVRVETALAATDSATVLVQNDASTNMTGDNLTSGLLVLAASATVGTGYTSSLLTNNTFTAGQRMRLITNKGTAGGTANVQVTYTRVD